MQKVLTIKDKTDQFDYVFIKNFCSLDIICKWKTETWRRWSTPHVTESTDRELVSIIHE